MRTYILIGIMCVACLLSFWFGKSTGIAQGKDEVQQEVEAMEMLLQDYITEDELALIRPEEGETTGSSAGTSEDTEKEVSTTGALVGNAGGSTGSTGNQNWDKSSILLVNKYNKLPDDYEVELKRMPDKTNYAAEEAYEPLCRMIKDARAAGMNLEICSSYRDVERQKELFEEDMQALVRQGYSYLEAYDEVAKETMPPGYSEHSTGLAFDIVALDYQMLDDKQEETEENQWLREHCAEYGFILRYPRDKEDITGISYESWHFRYVGQEVAEYIMEKGITLEEFLEE